jgi:hypothetical protein
MTVLDPYLPRNEPGNSGVSLGKRHEPAVVGISKSGNVPSVVPAPIAMLVPKYLFAK